MKWLVPVLLLVYPASAQQPGPCISVSGTGTGTGSQSFNGVPGQFGQGSPNGPTANNPNFEDVCSGYPNNTAPIVNVRVTNTGLFRMVNTSQIRSVSP